MGNSSSAETAIEFHEPIQALLRDRGLKLSQKAINKLLQDIDGAAPWFAVSGSLTVPSWEKLGRDLTEHSKLGELSRCTLPLWRLIHSCLKGGGCEDIIQRGRKALSMCQDSASEGENVGTTVNRPKNPKRRKEKQAEKQGPAPRLYPLLDEFKALHLSQEELNPKEEAAAEYERGQYGSSPCARPPLYAPAAARASALVQTPAYLLDNVLGELAEHLRTEGLFLAPEKIQKGDAIKFLGTTIDETTITPQKIEIRTNSLTTLNDFQRLLGDINWVRPYLSLTRLELKPLFEILEGNPDLNSPRRMTLAARKALHKVEQALMKAQLLRCEPTLPIWMCVLPTLGFPTGVLWQNGPLLWIHTKSLGMRTLSHYPSMVAEVALLGIKQCVSSFANSPDRLVVPYTKNQIEVLTATTSEWAILIYTFSGVIDNHLPKSELLEFMIQQPVIFPKVTVQQPLDDALTIYTDGSKSGKGAYMVQGQQPVVMNYRPGTPQVVECQVVLEVFRRFQEPFNLISDSLYVVNAVKILEITPYVKSSSTVATLLTGIRSQILSREQPFYITHIRAHSLLPGPMAKANEQVDLATRVLVALDPVVQAQEFHDLYHVSSTVLRKKFHITRELARHIVKSCSACAHFLPAQHVGVNPRGVAPNELWQMDVTHVSSFGKLQYVHVSIDTCSGVFHATPLSGERVHHVITHCLEAWAAWGKPTKIKTDNGPAYSSKSFALFCQRMQVLHVTGLPYNPQGQGIIERANRTLKELLFKQKGGIAENCTPKQRLSLALFTINFLNVHDDDKTAAERHVALTHKEYSTVMWKDVLSNQWKGPDRVIARSRGSLCVSPQDQDPIWVPSRLTRSVEEKLERDAECRTDDATMDDHALNKSRVIGRFLAGNWSREAERMILKRKIQILRLNATKLEPVTFGDFTSWLSSAFSFFKEWVGVATFAACCLFGIVLCLWLVCRIRVRARRDKVLLTQALLAIGEGDSPAAWLSALNNPR